MKAWIADKCEGKFAEGDAVDDSGLSRGYSLVLTLLPYR